MLLCLRDLAAHGLEVHGLRFGSVPLAGLQAVDRLHRLSGELDVEDGLATTGWFRRLVPDWW